MPGSFLVEKLRGPEVHLSMVIAPGEVRVKYELVFEGWENWDHQECNGRKREE